MFDFRYHALSLAAVLFALALGVLLGVAIGDTNLVSSAKNGVVRNLNAELGQARSQSGKLHEQLTSEEAFATGLYPLAVHELLAGRSIGLVIGSAGGAVDAVLGSLVDDTYGQTSITGSPLDDLTLERVSRTVQPTRRRPLA